MSTLREKQRKALMYGASNLQRSSRKNKKYVVTYAGKDIHFGDSRYQDYTQHGDKIRRESYIKRAMGIRNKSGRQTFRDKMSPNYWAIRILW